MIRKPHATRAQARRQAFADRIWLIGAPQVLVAGFPAAQEDEAKEAGDNGRDGNSQEGQSGLKVLALACVRQSTEESQRPENQAWDAHRAEYQQRNHFHEH